MSDILYDEINTTNVRFKYETIEGVEVPVICADIFSGYNTEVQVGTNGIKGGDCGHGSRTYINILTDDWYHIICRKYRFRKCGERGLEITAGGDWELQAIRDVAGFIYRVLDSMIKAKRNGN